MTNLERLVALADHPVKEFFVWAFSDEGMKLAESLAHSFRMPLRRRKNST